MALGRRHRASPADIVCTATLVTPFSIVIALLNFVFPKVKIHQLIVSGGGAHNPLVIGRLTAFLTALPTFPFSQSTPHAWPSVLASQQAAPYVSALSRLSTYYQSLPSSRRLSSIELMPSSRFGVPTDAKESLAFALLAYETFHQRPSNIPSATGARGPAILGKISYAPPR
jgi:anhydro-N-acetylmuramic acid kinase